MGPLAEGYYELRVTSRDAAGNTNSSQRVGLEIDLTPPAPPQLLSPNQGSLTRERNQSLPLSAAAYAWLAEVYEPAMERLKPALEDVGDPAELYCQVLEHKWYLSERAKGDVGMDRAIEDYLTRFEKE